MKNGSRIDRLTVAGFKSFGKRVTLAFDPGITAIVGPNGSGKSNIMDALSFVMGSLSFSSLRSKGAQNLIYKGKTKVASSAEVELVIASDSFEGGTLRISRKLLSNGTSIYRLNGSRSTRLAILDALASINIYPDGHNIVRQGDITRFVNMTPVQRRELIEVVAGIELYEKKKQRAMTDLEGVESRLSQVEAVHNERLRMYNRLKLEREKVFRFRELKSLQERARFGLQLEELRAMEEKIARLGEEKEKKQAQIERLEGEKEELLSKLESLTSRLEREGMQKKIELMTELERARMALQKVDSDEAREREALDSLKKRIGSVDSQIEGIERRKRSLMADVERDRKQLNDLERELLSLRKEKDGLVARMSELKQAYELKLQEYRRLKAQKDELALKVRELSVERSSLEGIIRGLEAQLKSEEQKKLSIEAERVRFMERQKSLEREQVQLEKQLKELTGRLSSLRREEKELIHSSGMPPGVRELRKKGYRLLGELVDDPTGVLPFAFSVVVPEGEHPELEAGWAHIIEGSVDAGELPKVGKVVGKLTPYEFQEESERSEKLRALRQEIEKLESERDALTGRLSTVKAELSRKFDSLRLRDTSERLSSLRRELSGRKKQMNAVEEKLKALNRKLLEFGELKEPKFTGEKKVSELTEKLLRLESEKMRLESAIRSAEDTIQNLLEPDLENYRKLKKELVSSQAELEKRLAGFADIRKKVKGEVEALEGKIAEIEDRLKGELAEKSKLEDGLKALQNRIYQLGADIKVIDERVRDTQERLNSLKESLPQGVEPVDNPRQVLAEVSRELSKLGELNFRAVEEFEEISKLMEDITDRLEKLREEKEAILKMMDEIEQQKRQVFMDTFSRINESFKRVFSEVMNGESWLEIDGEEIFESGVSIRTIVHGRELPTEALSGGQKTLAAIALIFAIQEVKPSPFYVFDEIEAALDKDNSEKLVRMLRKMSEDAQIIIITHNDVVVRESDQIIGVYISGGSSRILGLPKDKVLKEAESWIATENG